MKDNEPLGLFEELQERAKHYAEQGEAIRRRVLGAGPAANGAYAEPVNPFMRGTLRLKKPKGFFQGEGLEVQPRHLGGRRRTIWPEAKLDLPVATVVQAVTIESGLSVGDLMNPSRKKRLAWPRHVAMWAVDRYCPEYSLPEIGYMFRRDHTSVVHAIAVINNRLRDGCDATSALVANVRQRLAAAAQAE
jgi:Bacterial dnaA protein helix-turn-helix